jgi:hypothetical protein
VATFYDRYDEDRIADDKRTRPEEQGRQNHVCRRKRETLSKQRKKTLRGEMYGLTLLAT